MLKGWGGYLCSLLTLMFAGPSSALCWLLSTVPALLSGFCFAELAGQIPAAGSNYVYVYVSMEELPAVLAAGCLSLEYLVSASAIARGWGDKMVVWALAPPLGTGTVGPDRNFVGDNGMTTYDDGSSRWAARLLRPEELPAVLAARCLSLEYLVSTSAIARGWGDKMVVWALAPPLGTGTVGPDGNFVGDDGMMTYDDGSSRWAARLLRPRWNFNPLVFLLMAMASMMRVATRRAHSHCWGCSRTIG